MSQRLWLGCVLAALLLGAALRVVCLPAEFWLDEIWSYELARAAQSPADVFLHTRHDNNHHLNTLWLWLCPDDSGWIIYRLHSLAAGLASIVLAAKVARRWGKADAVFAAFFVAGCWWLVLCSAEARGYALAVCFALLALDQLWSYLEAGRWWNLVGFWLASILGFLSHLTFIHAYLGFVAWTLRRGARSRGSSSEEVRHLLLYHGVPGAFFVVFYLASIRGMEVGGGPPAPYADVLIRLASMGLGDPAGGWASLPWLIGAAVLFLLGLWLLSREPGESWVFFAVSVAASPLLIVLGQRPAFLFERYFFVPLVFFLLLSAHVLGTLWQSGWRGRILSAVVLLSVLAGNIGSVQAFASSGRGQFHEALAWVIEHDSNAIVEVTGDHDFRVRKYVDFYARYQSGSRRVVYLGKDDLPAGGANWLLVHRLDDRYPAPEEAQDAKGNRYRLVRSYPSLGLECWGWFVYRREE
jgi:hypothetical protein